MCALCTAMSKSSKVLRLNEAFSEAIPTKNKSALARLLGLDPAGASRRLSGELQLKTHEAKKLEEAWGIRAAWIEFGEEPKYASDTPVHELRHVSLEEEAREEEEELARRNAGYGTANEYTPSIEGALPEIDVHAGAGTGVVGEIINIRVGENTVAAHRVTDEWKIPEEYLTHELHVSPWQSLVMPVVGDSMSPTYQPGDRVVVDRRQTEMTIDAIYVISDGESPPQIKRLQRVMFSQPHMVDIISDNPAHQPQRVELSLLTIIGRVAGKVTKQ